LFLAQCRTIYSVHYTYNIGIIVEHYCHFLQPLNLQRAFFKFLLCLSQHLKCLVTLLTLFDTFKEICQGFLKFMLAQHNLALFEQDILGIRMVLQVFGKMVKCLF
jgi:hypothetical protein